MKNIITLTLHNENVNKFEALATSKTNNLQLVELYIRNVNTERGLWIKLPGGSINIHGVYVGQFMLWTMDINEVVKQDNLEFDTLGELIDFIKQYLTYTIEEYRYSEACV